jgi:Protein of unknown function (DUF2771)/Protein of unknown function (DUF3558)
MTMAVQGRALGALLLLPFVLSSCAEQTPPEGPPAPTSTALAVAGATGSCGLLDSLDEANLGLAPGTLGGVTAPAEVRTWGCTYISSRPGYDGRVVIVATEVDSVAESIAYRDDRHSGLIYQRQVLGIPALLLDKGSVCVVAVQATPQYTIAVEAPNGPEEFSPKKACSYSIEIAETILARNPDLPAKLLEPSTKEPRVYSFGPEVIFAAGGASVTARPVQYCDLEFTDCRADAAAPVRLALPVGAPLQVTVPDSVSEAPWTVVFSYRSASAEQLEGRSELFPAKQRNQYTLQLPAPTDSLLTAQVQQFGPAQANPQTGELEFPVRGSWVLTTS